MPQGCHWPYCSHSSGSEWCSNKKVWQHKWSWECFSCEASSSCYIAIALNGLNVEICCSSVHWKISQVKVKYSQMINRRLAARSTVCASTMIFFFCWHTHLQVVLFKFLFIFFIFFLQLCQHFHIAIPKRIIWKYSRCVAPWKDQWPSSCIKTAFCDWWNQSVNCSRTRRCSFSLLSPSVFECHKASVWVD